MFTSTFGLKPHAARVPTGAQPDQQCDPQVYETDTATVRIGQLMVSVSLRGRSDILICKKRYPRSCVSLGFVPRVHA